MLPVQKYTKLIRIFYLPSAAEEDGRQNPQIPSPQQRDFRHPEQVPEVWRRREHAGGTRPMLPATDTPVARQQLRCRSLRRDPGPARSSKHCHHYQTIH